MRKILLCSVVAAVLSGCAAQHLPMTREEYLATTTRFYPGKTKEDIFKAAEKLFTLSDGKDYSFTHTEASLEAARKWSIYLVLTASFGQDNWRVTAKDTEQGVKASVQASTQFQALQPMMVANGMNSDAYVTTGPLAGSPVKGNALYNLFWARMNYLLGERSDWMTCEQSDRNVKEGKEWGSNEALCNSFNVDDNDPIKPKERQQSDEDSID